eukprot:SAG31_NODE_128_length_23532_cov_21.204754_7_plen_75_part_00
MQLICWQQLGENSDRCAATVTQHIRRLQIYGNEMDLLVANTRVCTNECQPRAPVDYSKLSSMLLSASSSPSVVG